MNIGGGSWDFALLLVGVALGQRVFVGIVPVDFVVIYHWGRKIAHIHSIRRHSFWVACSLQLLYFPPLANPTTGDVAFLSSLVVRREAIRDSAIRRGNEKGIGTLRQPQVAYMPPNQITMCTCGLNLNGADDATVTASGER